MVSKKFLLYNGIPWIPWLKSAMMSYLNMFAAGLNPAVHTKTAGSPVVCAGVTPAQYVLESSSNAQKIWKVL